jgi:hypothetical protein
MIHSMNNQKLYIYADILVLNQTKKLKRSKIKHLCIQTNLVVEDNAFRNKLQLLIFCATNSHALKITRSHVQLLYVSRNGNRLYFSAKAN